MTDNARGDENSMVVQAQFQLHTEGKRQWFAVPFHSWPALAHRPAGEIVMEGYDGRYELVVYERPTDAEPFRKVIDVGSIERILKAGFKARAKYKRNGLE